MTISLSRFSEGYLLYLKENKKIRGTIQIQGMDIGRKNGVTWRSQIGYKDF